MPILQSVSDSTTSKDLGLFLLAVAFGAFAASCRALIRSGITRRWSPAAAALACLLVAVAALSLTEPGQNPIIQVAMQAAQGARTPLALIGAGLACGIVCAAGMDNQQRAARAALVTCFIVSCLLLSTIVLKPIISPHLEIPTATGSTGLGIQQTVVSGFVVEPFAQFSTFAPTSITTDESGVVFVAGYSGIALQNGVVMRLEWDGKRRIVTETVVASQLTRPHGIAFYKGDLYVSRAGQFCRAIGGQMVEQSTGAITRLRDLNSDGIFDDYTDIVKDLPGAQQPDGLHQNNGIAFDGDKLYITVGSPTDHTASAHPWAGTILQCDPDGSNLKIHARGLRNPYDLCIGPGGLMFCTDNDSNRSETGDELNHVIPMAHYGFPYATVEGLKVKGVREPIARLTSAQGLVYAKEGSLPRGFCNSIYLAAYGDGHINRIELERVGDSFRAKASFFAHVPNVVDVWIGADSSIYACSHHDRSVVRVRPRR